MIDSLPAVACAAVPAGLGDPHLAWLVVLANAATGLAYLVIAPQVLGLYRRPPHGARLVNLLLMVAFIAACGISHLLMVAGIWFPLYRVALAWQVLTALVSLAAMIAMPAAVAAVRAPENV